jgi:hypothetical protein
VPFFRPARELINSNVNGLVYPCEVGEIEPFGLMAKYQAGMIHDGWPKYQWVKLNQAHAMTAEHNFSTPDDIGRFVATLNLATHVNGGVLRCPLAGELEAARVSFAGLVARLLSAGLARSTADGWPIDPRLGKLWRARCRNGRPGEPIDIGLDEMIPQLERFLKDDMGEYGILNREPIEDPKTLWSLDLASRDLRNRDAASTGHGLIVGRYRLEGERSFWVLHRLTNRNQAQSLIGCWQSNQTMIADGI